MKNRVNLVEPPLPLLVHCLINLKRLFKNIIQLGGSPSPIYFRVHYLPLLFNFVGPLPIVNLVLNQNTKSSSKQTTATTSENSNKII